MLSDVASALAVLLVFLVGFLFSADPPRIDCAAGWWMPEPGVCERVTPERWERGPTGGWRDVSDPGERRGSRLRCSGGSRLRQSGTSAWCER